MNVNDQLVNQMLRNLPQDQRNIMAGILRSDITHEVVCPTQDVFQDVEVPLLDDDGSQVFYKSGKNKGQPRTTVEKQLVQAGANGRTIAYIHADGTVEPTKDENGFMWLRASRKRTDGEYGFECWDGTDSRIAPNELGILKADGTQPSREDLYRMAENLQKKPAQYATINGERHVDGFIIREVRK